MRIREAMTEHPQWISPEVTLMEAAQRMRDANIGCLPIGDNDRLVGMVTDRDLACRAVAAGLDPRTTKVRDVMTKGVVWCFDDETIDEAVDRMVDRHIHHIPVLSRSKRMVGMLALSDVALKVPTDKVALLSRLASRDSRRHQAAH